MEFGMDSENRSTKAGIHRWFPRPALNSSVGAPLGPVIRWRGTTRIRARRKEADECRAGHVQQTMFGFWRSTREMQSLPQICKEPYFAIVRNWPARVLH